MFARRAFEEAVEKSPQLRRGKVWCLKCGRELNVNAVNCLSNGWPKCCLTTMSVSSPDEIIREKLIKAGVLHK